MIKVDNVSFKYKNSNFKVLENLSFNVYDGEVVAIVGKNGSGKSTIGRLLAGITKLKSGSIMIDDLDVSKSKNYQAIRDKVGIVFQNPENQIIFNNIYDELSFSFHNTEKSEVDKCVDMALQQVGMFNFKNQDLYSLSLGQKQRIVIAEVLAKKPKYIIFDEPTSMLDGKAKEKIYEIISDLKNSGYTVICITNVADEILIADRTLFLRDGNIACEIEKKDLINSASVFRDFDIKVPTLLEIIFGLKDMGIIVDVPDFSVDNLVRYIGEKLK